MATASAGISPYPIRRAGLMLLDALLFVAIATPGATAASATPPIVLTQGPAVAFPIATGLRLVGAPGRVGLPDAPAVLVDRATGSRVLARIRGSRFFIDAAPDGSGGAWLVGTAGRGLPLELVRVDHRGRRRVTVDLRATGLARPIVPLGRGRVAVQHRDGIVVVSRDGRVRSPAGAVAGDDLVGGGAGVVALSRRGRTVLVSVAAGRRVLPRVRLPRGAVVLVTARDVILATSRSVRRLARRSGRVLERHVASVPPGERGIAAIAEAGGTLWIGGGFDRIDGTKARGLVAFRRGRRVPLRGGLRRLGPAVSGIWADAAGALATGDSDDPAVLAISPAGRASAWARTAIAGLDVSIPLGDRGLLLNLARGAIASRRAGAVTDVALPAVASRIRVRADRWGRVAASAGRDRLWIARATARGRTRVVLVDRGARVLRRLPPLRGTPDAIAADGARVVIVGSDHGRRVVSRLDAAAEDARWTTRVLCRSVIECVVTGVAVDASTVVVASIDAVDVLTGARLARTAHVALGDEEIEALALLRGRIVVAEPATSGLSVLDPATGALRPFGPSLARRSPGALGDGEVTALRATSSGLLVCGLFAHAGGARRAGLMLLDPAGRLLPYRQPGGGCDRIESGHGKVVLAFAEETRFRVVPGPEGT